MTCNAAQINAFLQPLTTSFSDIWLECVKNAPTRSGEAFGSCYSICGSVGITNVSLQDIAIDPVTSRLFFSQCAIRDYALILVQIPEQNLDVNVTIRATGSVSDTTFTYGPQTMYATFSGNMLITVPITIKQSSTKFEFSDCMVDANLNARFTPASLVSVSSMLNADLFYNSLPIESTLNTYVASLNAYLKKEVPGRFRRLLQANDLEASCTVPGFSAQQCTSSVSPTMACDICDTCCKCMMQQRCDNECEGCKCISCSSPILGSIFMYTCILLVLVFIFFYLRHKQF